MEILRNRDGKNGGKQGNIQESMFGRIVYTVVNYLEGSLLATLETQGH